MIQTDRERESEEMRNSTSVYLLKQKKKELAIRNWLEKKKTQQRAKRKVYGSVPVSFTKFKRDEKNSNFFFCFTSNLNYIHFH